jgi:ketosteroid isomerase-like protein
MKNLIAFIVIAILGTLPASSQNAPQAGDEVGAAITALREGLVSSFRKGDIDTLLTHLSPDVVVTWQNGEVCRGTEAVRAFHVKMMSGEKRIVKEIQSSPEILGRQVYGDWAVSWGNLHDHFLLMDGSDLPFNSVFTATVAKRGDRWLVTAFHVSVSAFENPVLGTAVKKSALWSGIGAGVLGVLGGLIIGRRCRKA